MEKLYNNIILLDDFAKTPSDAQNVPYLKNPPEIINVNTYPLITLKEGGYICEITAVWNENVRPYYGEVSYCFYGIVESES